MLKARDLEPGSIGPNPPLYEVGNKMVFRTYPRYVEVRMPMTLLARAYDPNYKTYRYCAKSEDFGKEEDDEDYDYDDLTSFRLMSEDTIVKPKWHVGDKIKVGFVLDHLVTLVIDKVVASSVGRKEDDVVQDDGYLYYFKMRVEDRARF